MCQVFALRCVGVCARAVVRDVCGVRFVVCIVFGRVCAMFVRLCVVLRVVHRNCVLNEKCYALMLIACFAVLACLRTCMLSCVSVILIVRALHSCVFSGVLCYMLLGL